MGHGVKRQNKPYFEELLIKRHIFLRKSITAVGESCTDTEFDYNKRLIVIHPLQANSL